MQHTTDPLYVYDVGLEIEAVAEGAFPSGAIGGFVCCFVLATTLEDALALSREAMSDNGYRAVDADHCVRIDLEDYDLEEGNPDLSDLLKLNRRGDYALSVIHAFERVFQDAPN